MNFSVLNARVSGEEKHVCQDSHTRLSDGKHPNMDAELLPLHPWFFPSPVVSSNEVPASDRVAVRTGVYLVVPFPKM